MVTFIPALTVYYQSSSPNSQLVYLIIKSLNLDSDSSIKLVDFDTDEQLLTDIIALNPQFTIPTLIDHIANDFLLWEPRTIATYIIESCVPGHSMYPVDPVRRAIINQRLYFDADTLTPRVEKILDLIWHSRSNVNIERDDEDKILEAFSWLEGFLECHRWVADNEPTIADIVLFCSLIDIVELGACIDKFPKLSSWYQDLNCFTGFEFSVKRAKDRATKIKTQIHITSSYLFYNVLSE